jgi:hypothetical protein
MRSWGSAGAWGVADAWGAGDAGVADGFSAVAFSAVDELCGDPSADRLDRRANGRRGRRTAI